MKDIVWDMRKHGHSFLCALAILWLGSSDKQKELLEVIYKEDIDNFKKEFKKEKTQ